jgi:hypothetical protein
MGFSLKKASLCIRGKHFWLADALGRRGGMYPDMYEWRFIKQVRCSSDRMRYRSLVGFVMGLWSAEKRAKSYSEEAFSISHSV